MQAARMTRRLYAGAVLLAIVACAPLPPKQFQGPIYSRLHADWLPPHSRRLAFVIDLATRPQIEKLRIAGDGETAYSALRMAGIPDGQIVDGSLAAAATVCCGGRISKESVVLFYVPEPGSVALKDIVEIEVGEPKTRAFPNTFRNTRQKDGAAGTCDWHPRNPNLWMRVLYCEGLEKEGWRRQSGEPSFWFKPPPRKGKGNAERGEDS